MWPLKEAVEGRVRHTYVPDRRRPVEDYLASPRRFRLLLVPVCQEEVLAAIQASAGVHWDRGTQRHTS